MSVRHKPLRTRKSRAKVHQYNLNSALFDQWFSLPIAYICMTHDSWSRAFQSWCTVLLKENVRPGECYWTRNPVCTLHSNSDTQLPETASDMLILCPLSQWAWAPIGSDTDIDFHLPAIKITGHPHAVSIAKGVGDITTGRDITAGSGLNCKMRHQDLPPDLHASLLFADTATIFMPLVQKICLQINAKSHCKFQV